MFTLRLFYRSPLLSRSLYSAIIHNETIYTKDTFDNTNPSNNQLIDTVSNCTVQHTQEAIESAAECFTTFKTSLPAKRAQLLTSWADLITANTDKISRMITIEMGKPLNESRGEIAYAVSFLHHFAAQIKTGLTGEVLTPGQAHWRPINIRQPVGPVATITPWNFPVAMITRKAGAAIAAGCSVINAPSEDTPITSLMLAELGVEAGFPPGLYNVVPCSRENKQGVGELLCSSTDIAAISFTGSTAVGKHLTKQSADSVKRVHMELGGNAPLIVFSSADIDRAVKGTMMAKFKNAGQACNAANRILVHSSLYNEYIHRLYLAVIKLRMGDGLAKGVDIGPLVNTKSQSKVNQLVETAKTSNIELITGGSTPGGAFYDPTIISCQDNTDLDLFGQEIFGPVAAVYKFDSEAEAVQLANNSRYGLQAYIFTQDLAQSWRVSEALEYGMIAVNEGAISSSNNPFGGWKESGVGREAGHFGIDEFTENKLICFGL